MTAIIFPETQAIVCIRNASNYICSKYQPLLFCSFEMQAVIVFENAVTYDFLEIQKLSLSAVVTIIVVSEVLAIMFEIMPFFFRISSHCKHLECQQVYWFLTCWQVYLDEVLATVIFRHAYNYILFRNDNKYNIPLSSLLMPSN